MGFLFFDIECCDGRHICSFGYVITDDNFRVIEKADLLINPQKPFMPSRVLRMLAYPKSDFRQAPVFAGTYSAIAALFNRKDLTFVGHAVSNDFGFLNFACARYGLPYFNVDFYDSQILYAYVTGEVDKRPSLGAIAEFLELNLEATPHKSDDDALTVMETVKKLCEISGETAAGLLKKYRPCKGFARNGARYVYSTNYARIFKFYIRKFKPAQIIENPALAGKRIAFSPSFEKNMPLKLWTLAEHIISNGAEYCELQPGINYLVWDKSPACYAYKFIKRKPVNILSIDGLCLLLGIGSDITDHFTDNYCPVGTADEF